MNFLAEAIDHRSLARSAMSDLRANPLPVGAPFGTPWTPAGQVKAVADVFGLRFARPYPEAIPMPPLEYDEELQVSLCPIAGPWDEQVFPSLQSTATIERTEATGTIRPTVDPCGCPDRARDSDPSDRFRD